MLTRKWVLPNINSAWQSIKLVHNSKFLDLRSFDGNQRIQKWPKMNYLLPNVSFGCKPTEAFKSHPEAWEALIIKWSICGEPHIGIKTHQGSKGGRNYALHYIVLLSWPCRFLTEICAIFPLTVDTNIIAPDYRGSVAPQIWVKCLAHLHTNANATTLGNKKKYFVLRQYD